MLFVAYLSFSRSGGAMQERWAVAYEPCDMEQGRYLWLRDSGGEIVIFGSRGEARKWVLAKISFGMDTDDVMYVKLPRKNA
jgi:hypothetical protein